MKIKLSPMRLDQTLALKKAGDKLYLNEEEFDFSSLPEGATLPKEAINCQWFASGVERRNGALHFSLVLPHGANAPPETLFPDMMHIKQDGPVALPLYEIAPAADDNDFLDGNQ